MNYFLRTIIGLGIVLLALSVTALSCNKAGGDKSNSGNNSSGDNTPKPSTPTIIITNFLTGKAKLGPKTNDGGKEYDTILINADALKTNQGGLLYASDIENVAGAADSDLLGNLFDLTITGGVVGDAAAEGGLVLVSTGDLANIDDFETPTPGATTVPYESGTYVAFPLDGTPAPIYRPVGFNFFGIFADQTAPTTAAASEPGNAPFAFTRNRADALAGQPLLSCRANITTITHRNLGNPGTAVPDKLLTGGQTSKCFLLARFRFESDAHVTEWFTAANTAETDGDATTQWKRAFYISVAGFRTDNKKLSEVLKGFTQGTDQAKVDEFMNGISKAEMKLIADNKDHVVAAYKKILVRIVPNDQF